MANATTVDIEETLAAVEERLGLVPQVMHELATSAPAAFVYAGGQLAMLSGAAALAPEEQNAVQLAISTANGSPYDISGHLAFGRMLEFSDEQLEHVGRFEAPGNRRLDLILRAARRLYDSGGRLTEADRAALEEEGLQRGELYELVALIGLKTVSNYVANLAGMTSDPNLAG